MKLKFKKPTEDDVVFSGDPEYDLFHGGYIKPEDMLDDDDQVAAIYAAVYLVNKFLDSAYNVGWIKDR